MAGYKYDGWELNFIPFRKTKSSLKVLALVSKNVTFFEIRVIADILNQDKVYRKRWGLL